MHYYDYEEEAMLAGVEPQLAQVIETPPGETPITAGPPPAQWQEYGIDPKDLIAVMKGESTGSGWPAEVNVEPAAWVSLDPPRYQIQGGDTWSGLAATYLGAHERWRDLWDEQPQSYRWSHSPDKLGIGEVVNMSAEARDNFVAWMKRGKPGVPPGKIPPTIPGTTKEKLKKALPLIAAGTVAAVVIAAVAKG
jgi:hypothetical protein